MSYLNLEGVEPPAQRLMLNQMVQLEEKAERYDDMVYTMGNLLELLAASGEDMTLVERRRLCVAFKNALAPRRAAWRTVCSPPSGANEQLTRLSVMLKRQLTSEIEHLSQRMIQLLQSFLSNVSEAMCTASKVFYLRLLADYHRYIAEISASSESNTSALACYTKAITLAENNLSATDPIRLSLILNAAVFTYDVLRQPERACTLASYTYMS